MMPENTIPAFLYALDEGVTTLELDVVISKDKKVVVSHEPWMSPEICLDPTNSRFTEAKRYNIYQMTYREISAFNCGWQGSKGATEADSKPVSKPLLSEVIKKVEMHIKSYTQYEVDYNIELKSTVSGDNTFHPPPKEFSDLVYKLINQYLPMDRIIIQSFDFRVLQYWHSTYPEVRLAALIDNKKSIDTNLANLGFKPHIYSPEYSLVTEATIKNLHYRGIKVVPWTVNNDGKMLELVSWNVDGIITDFPNRAKALGLTLPIAKTAKTPSP